MIGVLIKTLGVVVAAGVALPYTAAFLCNVLNGWPQRKDKFRRAFNPRKVYALNYVLIQKIMLYFRYAPEYIQWRAYYKMTNDIVKDIPFGRNDKSLDLYLPQQRGSMGDNSYPVVLFVYGGAWGSGDKNMYGFVCSSVAKRLGAIVCCPNYLYYPRGYVDDMVQDVVDCVSWLYQNVHQYQGNKMKIMLFGHSAGAHLCAMSVLELLHDELVKTGSDQSQPSSVHLKESESHERGQPDGDEESSGSSGSFCVVNDAVDSSSNHESENFTNGPDESQTEPPRLTESFESSASMMTRDLEDLGLRHRGSAPQDVECEDEREDDDSGDDDSVVTVKQTESDRQPTLTELSQSIKAIVGLAGVYDIADHFQHESKRGVEDVSSMTRAMYGEDHFQRFSPSFIVSQIDKKISLPKVMLVHGTDDYVVPVSSTTKFGEILRKYHSDVIVRIIPGCDHYELCLDLANSSKKHHNIVLQILKDVADSVF